LNYAYLSPAMNAELYRATQNVVSTENIVNFGKIDSVSATLTTAVITFHATTMIKS